VAPRPYWKGYLKLSLVSCPIALTPATSSSEKVSFRQVNKGTGNRIRYKKVDAETDEEVSSDQIGKGYEVGKNEYLIMDDEELEDIQLESNHTIDIDQFVPFTQIDKRYYDQPYYIVPNDEVGAEAFAVIRKAMEGKGVTALGRVVMNKRERVIALEPWGRGLLGTTLHYDYEVRKADDYFDDIPDVKIPNDMLKLAEHIVESKEGDFQPDLFVDHYETALVEVIRKKQAHVPLKKSADKVAAPKNVINLMDALRRSVQGGDAKPAAKAAAPTPKATGKKGKKRVEGQREMLLPIAGKKKEAAKETAKPAARRKAS
jgi:DNA end-binding protein Ku